MYGLIGAVDAGLIPVRHYLANRVLHSNEMLKKSLTLTFLIAETISRATSPEPPVPEYITLEGAQPVLAKADWLPPGLRGAALTSESWTIWIRSSDREVRERLDRGEEDTLSNLLRFGVTFTKEYRIDDEYFRRLGRSEERRVGKE